MIAKGLCFLALAGTAALALSPPAPAADAALRDEPLQPLPELSLDPAKVALGRSLFHDKRMSRDGTVSCASCHDFARGGSDPRPRSVGVGGVVGDVNSMSIFNLAFQRVLNWDGRNANLAQQFERSVPNRKNTSGSWPVLLDVTRGDPSLARQFAAVYPDGVTQANYIDAATTYVRSLATPSRFDRFLRGDAAALDDEEKEGYAAFKAAGCAGCHAGVAVGGDMLAKLGLAEDYFLARATRGAPPSKADNGRFNATAVEADRHVFKVPSLRNVALTAPYFHDGAAATLDEAVEAMFRFQLGRRTTAAERRPIVKFLGSLTGEALPSHP